MGKFKATFSKIKNAKNTTQFLDRLPDGIHTLTLLRFQPKNSDAEMGVIVEADFCIEQTNVPAQSNEPSLVGSKRGWPWFIEQKGWGGAYEQDRSKKFISTCGGSFTSEEDLTAIFEIIKQLDPTAEALDVETLGDLMSDDSQPLRGLQLRVEVTPKMKNGARMRDSKGKPMSDAVWSSISQTLASVFERRDALDAAAPASHPNAPGQGTAPHPASAAAPVAAAPAPVAVAAPKNPIGGFMKTLGKG